MFFVRARKKRHLSLYFFCSCVPYVPAPENTNLLLCALKLYRKFGQAPHAMRLAMQLNDKKLIEDIFNSCSDW